MTVFLFWNLNKKPLQRVIANLAHLYSIDVLMLVECSINVNDILTCLNNDTIIGYNYVPIVNCNKVELFVRFPSEFIRPIYEENRLTIRHLTLPGLTDILLAISHYPSKLHWDEPSQALECCDLATTIQKQEIKFGNPRTILVGDLNMNPFEDGVVSAGGLHGIMSRNIAIKKSRIVNSKEYTYFYNPMWNHFGDLIGPPGTYYYNSSRPRSYFWNIFDQVMIRPELLSRFNTKDLEILTSDGEISFLTNEDLPNTRLVSDHLPILFRISL